MSLTMREFLEAVRVHGVEAREKLMIQGHHPKVIISKAEKASRRGYYDYGVVADRGWLTDEGRSFLALGGTDE